MSLTFCTFDKSVESGGRGEEKCGGDEKKCGEMSGEVCWGRGGEEMCGSMRMWGGGVEKCGERCEKCVGVWVVV